MSRDQPRQARRDSEDGTGAIPLNRLFRSSRGAGIATGTDGAEILEGAPSVDQASSSHQGRLEGSSLDVYLETQVKMNTKTAALTAIAIQTCAPTALPPLGRHESPCRRFSPVSIIREEQTNLRVRFGFRSTAGSAPRWRARLPAEELSFEQCGLVPGESRVLEQGDDLVSELVMRARESLRGSAQAKTLAHVLLDQRSANAAELRDAPSVGARAGLHGLELIVGHGHSQLHAVGRSVNRRAVPKLRARGSVG